MTEIEQLRFKIAQAYQVIGTLVEYVPPSTEITRALDYFAHLKYEDDFLPWHIGLPARVSIVEAKAEKLADLVERLIALMEKGK